MAHIKNKLESHLNILQPKLSGSKNDVLDFDCDAKPVNSVSKLLNLIKSKWAKIKE